MAHSEPLTQRVEIPAAQSPPVAAVCQDAPGSRRTSRSTEKILCREPSRHRTSGSRTGRRSFLHSSYPQRPRRAGERADRPAASRLQTQAPLSPTHSGLGRGACTLHGHQTSSRQTAGDAALGSKDGSGQAQPRAGLLRSPPDSTSEPCVPHPRPRRAQAQWKHAHCACHARTLTTKHQSHNLRAQPKGERLLRMMTLLTQ